MEATATLSLIASVQAKRAAQGLLVRWKLPNGKEWSAYASTEKQKQEWIQSKAKIGWLHIAQL